LVRHHGHTCLAHNFWDINVFFLVFNEALAVPDFQSVISAARHKLVALLGSKADTAYVLSMSRKDCHALQPFEFLVTEVKLPQPYLVVLGA
jgi:hypothetical protein